MGERTVRDSKRLKRHYLPNAMCCLYLAPDSNIPTTNHKKVFEMLEEK